MVSIRSQLRVPLNFTHSQACCSTILQDAEVLIRYDDKLKVMEAQAVDHQLRDFASVDRGLVDEAAISMTNALKSAGASASKAIQKLGDATRVRPV